MVAAPWLYAWVARVVLQALPVGSQLRERLLGASFRSGYAAFNRRDYELLLVRYTPDCEFVTSFGLQSLGAEDSIRSHDGLRQFVQAIGQTWDGWELTPAGFVDLGDRVMWLGTQRAHGGASQIPIVDQYAQLQDLERGLICRQQAFSDWDSALAAAGLSPDQVTGLEALRAGVGRPEP
jgi:hypothetical protein